MTGSNNIPAKSAMLFMYFTNSNATNFLRYLNQLPTYRERHSVRAWEIKSLLCCADVLLCWDVLYYSTKKSDINIHNFNRKFYRMPKYIQRYNIQLSEEKNLVWITRVNCQNKKKKSVFGKRQSNTKYYEQSFSFICEYTDTFFCFIITTIRQAAGTYTQEIHISVTHHTNPDPDLSFTMMSIQKNCHDSVPV